MCLEREKGQAAVACLRIVGEKRLVSFKNVEIIFHPNVFSKFKEACYFTLPIEFSFPCLPLILMRPTPAAARGMVLIRFALA